jgi:two-component system chemotaxis response regulator CheB
MRLVHRVNTFAEKLSYTGFNVSEQAMAAVNRRFLKPDARIRVLVVDDSALTRRLITRALEQQPGIEVAGAASNGVAALERIPELKPDVLTLDVEMPEMDGLETLRRIRREHPHLRVIMLSSLTERGAAVTLQALTLGADDYVAKPSHEASLARLGEELARKIKQFFHWAGESRAPAFSGAATFSVALSSVHKAPPLDPLRDRRVRPRAVAIGVSTGGPAALSTILPKLPSGFPLPVLVVQHMPALFTRSLAERLQSICALPVREGTHGEPVTAGTILVAPGNFHMRVASDGGVARIALDESAPMNSCRPAVDALFTSVADVYGGAAIAVILTGMGQDGLRGAQAMKARGASILAQDQESSVVWGMPGAIVGAGIADRVLPLSQIASEILRMAT